MEGKIMPDFSDFADEAKKLASEHPDTADKVIEQAGQVADEKTGGRFSSQIDEGEERARQFLGTDSQDSQDQQAGNA
jgi:hypothetical protein